MRKLSRGIFKIALFLFVGFGSLTLSAQNLRWQEVDNETVYVASTSKASLGFSRDRDRILREIKLPKGTIGYVMRITVNVSGNGGVSNLLNTVSAIPDPEAKAASAVASLALSGDGNQGDIFIFNDEENANNFYNKVQGWRACQLYKQTASLCKYSNDCLDMIYFGFRNENMVTGLHIKFEIEALVSEGINMKEDLNRLRAADDHNGIINYCVARIKQGHELAGLYNTLGWECLITKQFTKGRYYLEIAANKFPLDLYVQGNYAHALLLTQDYDKAIEIYRRYLNENLSDNKSWRNATLGDIEKFKRLGIQCDHFDDVINIMK